MASKQTRRTRPGVKWLRDRFVLRAKSLTRDPDFREQMGVARETWNERYPDYSIVLSTDVRTEPPDALVCQVEEDRQNDAKSARAVGEPWVLMRHQSFEAMDHWVRFISRLSAHSFPRTDFPYPGFAHLHPARRFITASLYKDLHEQDIEYQSLIAPIEEFRLRVMPVVTESARLRWTEIGDPPTPDEIVDWCIPVYPGMTANDLIQSATRIAQEAEEIFPDSSAQARMQALREEGLTHRQIAEQLGIDIKTVSAKLTGIPRGRLLES